MKIRWLNAVATFALFSSLVPAHAQTPKLQWYRGNTHTHTLNQDGNASPDTVVRWYREHGYQFVVITDHEYVADVAPLNTLFGAEGRFLVLPGQEVTQVLADPTHPDGKRQAHVNGIGLPHTVMPIGSDEGVNIAKGITMSDTYTRNIGALRQAGALPQVNHPNLHWSVRPDDLAKIAGPFLLEVWNSFPIANNAGGTNEKGETSLSTEELWDVLLSRGQLAWAVASDDSHDYLHLDDFDSTRPGKAWIVVHAPELTPDALLEAMRNGEFYASNGISLEDYSADRLGVALSIKQPINPRGGKDNRRFTTRFIGKNGRVLAEVAGLKASYTFRGDEGYVRAAIVDSNGLRALTQPVFLDSRLLSSVGRRAVPVTPSR
ncbi:CehA/McbA family metallohydrolase [Steroidobacter flavus]|uniref:CehA/McbA family metallohydrolase n=1 Tax=Steroidobacter flavus TaxID=1842136 RepID=A0ABV8SPM7_9GAMM